MMARFSVRLASVASCMAIQLFWLFCLSVLAGNNLFAIRNQSLWFFDPSAATLEPPR
jgi:hypothetical protein